MKTIAAAKKTHPTDSKTVEIILYVLKSIGSWLKIGTGEGLGQVQVQKEIRTANGTSVSRIVILLN